LTEQLREQVRELEWHLLEQIESSEELPEHAVIDLVIVYSRTGRQEEAAQWIKKLLDSAGVPEEKVVYLLQLGQLSEQVGDYHSALGYYTLALDLQPKNSALRYLAHNNLGYCLNQFASYDEAESQCRTAIRIDPGRHNAYKNLGVSLEGQEQYIHTVECYIQAVKRYPYDRRALDHLEDLLDKHPEVSREYKDLESELERCRAAVSAARSKH
jgi:tetratricopeptide (TPR) repeat protein